MGATLGGLTARLGLGGMTGLRRSDGGDNLWLNSSIISLKMYLKLWQKFFCLIELKQALN